MRNRFLGLPWQNMIVIASVLYVGEWGAILLMPRKKPAPALAAALWGIMVLLARVASRLTVRRFFQPRNPGFWTIGLAAALTATAQFFVSTVTEAGIEVREIAVRFVTTFILLLIVTPWFFRKEEFSTLSSASKKP